MTPQLSRRQFFALGGGLTLTGLAASACGSPVVSSLVGTQPAPADVVYWHLFGGGDGENMTTMVSQFEKTKHLSVEATLLSWGNPYYTKLALAASSGRPPDVAISHLSRLPLLAEAGLVEPVDQAGVEAVGITKDKFTPAAWKKATVHGTTYAVPLDTHPFVLYYNVELARKAHLLDATGKNLKPIKGKQQFIDALQAMKDAGARYGAVCATVADPATAWRWFMTVYSGIAGPVVTNQGTKIAVDRSALEETFDFIQTLTTGKHLMPADAADATVSTLFAGGSSGFLFDGEWQIPTYRGVTMGNGKKLDFNVVPFPALLGPKPVAYADSHSLIVPHSSVRSATRTKHAVEFIKGLLDESFIWASGGHVPAWLPVQNSSAFKKLQPQSNYVQAAFNAVYDPAAWYTGAGSDFQNAVGGVVASVMSGALNPTSGANSFISQLKTFTTATPPVR
jgi:multiple sugar transport system substrate-binding protein